MTVYNNRVSFQCAEDSMEDLYQKIEDGEQCVAKLKQAEAFQLIQWVIVNRPASELLQELRKCHFTLAQERTIRRLEASYQTPICKKQLPYRGDILSTPFSPESNLESVKRRLFFDEDEEVEVKPDCSVFKCVLVLGGTCVIYLAIVKPIFKQIGKFFQKDVGKKL